MPDVIHFNDPVLTIVADERGGKTREVRRAIYDVPNRGPDAKERPRRRLIRNRESLLGEDDAFYKILKNDACGFLSIVFWAQETDNDKTPKLGAPWELWEFRLPSSTILIGTYQAESPRSLGVGLPIATRVANEATPTE